VNTATPAPSASATARPSSSAAPLAPEQTAQASPAAARAAAVGTWLWLVLALVVVLALGLVPAALRAMVRRRRLRGLAAGSATALTAWHEMFDTAADLGIDIPETATPRDAAELFALSIGGASRDPIDRVRAAVESESYGQARSTVLTASASLAGDLRRVIGDLRSSADRGRRLRATLVPASAWDRIRRAARIGD
jgi:hypothetical protein